MQIQVTTQKRKGKENVGRSLNSVSEHIPEYTPRVLSSQQLEILLPTLSIQS